MGQVAAGPFFNAASDKASATSAMVGAENNADRGNSNLKRGANR
jgi:hypothetical protein